MESKMCPRCDNLKPSADFFRNCRQADGLQFYCKQCQMAASRDSRQRARPAQIIMREIERIMALDAKIRAEVLRGVERHMRAQ